MNLLREADPLSLSVSSLTLHRNPPSHTSFPTKSSTLCNANLMQPLQSSPEHTSLHMGQHLPSDQNSQPQSLFSPISFHGNPVDLTILPSVAAPTQGETGYLIRSSLQNGDRQFCELSFVSYSSELSYGEYSKILPARSTKEPIELQGFRSEAWVYNLTPE